MTAFLRALVEWVRRVENETPEQYMARKYPRLGPQSTHFWTDGTY